MVINVKQLRDAEALVEKGDLARASDKLWDAVTQAVKVSTKEWTAETPREIRRLVERLFRETGDRDLLRLYSVVESLKANASDDFMSAEAVRAYTDDVRELIEKLYAVPGVDGAQAPSPAPVSPEEAVETRRRTFSARVERLTRREVRKELLAELARVDGQLDNLKPGSAQAQVPGLPESRIARAMNQLERQRPEDPAAVELGLYKQWLLGLMLQKQNTTIRPPADGHVPGAGQENTHA